MPSYDPKEKVELSKVDRRGDWTRVEGFVGGKKISADIPNPTMDQQRTRKDGEALMRRALLGTSQMPSEQA